MEAGRKLGQELEKKAERHKGGGCARGSEIIAKKWEGKSGWPKHWAGWIRVVLRGLSPVTSTCVSETAGMRF